MMSMSRGSILLFALVSSAVTAASAAPQSPRKVVPGIQKGTAPLVSPEAARSFRAQMPQHVGGTGPETEITPEIVELARGLRHDPKLIHEFVRNNVDYVPIYGAVRSATMTLQDRRGNDFDQTSLLIALMRESGLQASYIYGLVRLNAATISGLLGVPANANVVGGILASAGIPATVFINGTGALVFVELDHVWAKVVIDGTSYVFDPSVKGYLQTAGINLATAMGYDQATFLANATSGATVDTNFVQNVNHANIHEDFASYSTSLGAAVRVMNGAKLKDVVGGREIVQLRNQPFVTTLPYELSRDFEWVDVPASVQTMLSVQHLGIDEDLPVPAVFGKRLTITYNAATAPELKIDGSTVATGTAVAPGSFNSITVSADHPYAAFGGTYGDQSSTRSIEAGGTYVIVNGWAEPGREVVEKHKRLALENSAAGNPDDSEPVLGETLTVIALTWLGEAAAAVHLADDVGKTTTIQHHTVGFCGQTDSPFIDLPMGFVSVISDTGSADDESASFFAGAGISSALEWGVFDQMQDVSAVSTVKLIDISSDKGDRIFDATSANFPSIVQPQLVGYSGGEIALVQSFLNAGYRVILPQDGNLGEGDWSGVGFLAISSDENQIGHIISGGLSGGEGILEYLLDPTIAGEMGLLGLGPGDHVLSFDPIDLVRGDFLVETKDLTLGNGEFPFELELARHYNSGARGKDGEFGRGWTHALRHVALGVDTDGFKGLGEESPLDAVPGIVELYVALDLLSGPKTHERLVIGTVAHRWFMDRLIDNLVVFEHGGTTQRFLEYPDGSFQAPPGSAGLLSAEGDGSYRIQEKDGVLIDFDLGGKIETWTDRNANAAHFAYGGALLQSVSNDLGRSLSFSYTGLRITEVSDSAGRVASYEYDVDGNLTTYTDPISNVTTYAYDEPGRMTQILYPANPLDPFVTNAYDSFSRVIAQTDANSNTYDYFYSGARTEEEDPLGNSNVWHFDLQGKTVLEIDAFGRETSHAYDGHRRLVRSTYPELNAILREYDTRHNETRVVLQPKPGSGQVDTQKLFTYEPVFSQLVSMTDQQGRVTTHAYDGNGNLTSTTLPQVGSQTPIHTYTYNARGQVTTETDPEGMVTRYTYDPVSAALLDIALDHGGLALTNQMVYDAVGNVVQTIDPLGNATTMTYDDRRLIDEIISPAPFGHVRNFDYDADGNLVRDERETGIGGNPWQTTEFTYTLSGKKASSIDPAGNASTWEYDALERVSRFTDAEQNPVDFTYDAAGQLFRVIDSLGSVQEEYTWHPNGQKASTKDAKGNTTSFLYDGFDKLRRENYPNGSFEQHTYDAVGNTLTRRMRSGTVITYTYDALDRVATKSVPGSFPSSVQYIYDKVGRLIDATDALGTTHHEYDGAGRLISVTDPDARTVESEYDAASRRTSLTHPDGYFITYSYDELGRLEDVLESGVTPIVHYDYDPLDRRVAAIYGNGTTTSYAREIDDDVTSIDHALTGGSVSVAYTYDLVGNRLTRTDAAGLHAYAYDANYRLTGVAQPGDDLTYVYDAAGNRVSETVGSSTTSYVTNSLNQYTSVGGQAYSYDGNGNLASDGVRVNVYDAENRMRRVLTSDTDIDYAYDVFGRRVSKEITPIPIFQPVFVPNPPDPDLTLFVYDGNQVIQELDGTTGQVLRRFVYGTYIDEPVLMQAGATDSYYHSDALGSILALSDATGAEVESHSYAPYGEIDGLGALGNPYFFTGQRFDEETGFYFYRARYYDPRIGRFLSPDPIGFAGGTNFYEYAANSPVMFVDPLGLDWLTNLSNFSAGFGDSLSFGLTGVVRGWMGVDDVVDRSSGWYRGGEYTEVAIEVTLTLGSAALKQGAKQASREVVRAEYRAATRHIARDGKELHHLQPLFGHPGGAPTLFPTGGLPAWIHSSRLNTQLLDRAAHLEAHRRLLMLERAGIVIVNPLTTGGRIGRILLIDRK